MAHLTTHILDSTTGLPATGVAVTLAGPDGAVIASGETDADGRLTLGPEVLAPGIHSLSFETEPYFVARGVEAFYPSVTVSFTVADRAHYHVPLLLSPFAYSTYRGS